MNDTALAERLKAAIELIEKVAENRALLAELPTEDRTRLLQAAGKIHTPDLEARRRLVKAVAR